MPRFPVRGVWGSGRLRAKAQVAVGAALLVVTGACGVGPNHPVQPAAATGTHRVATSTTAGGRALSSSTTPVTTAGTSTTTTTAAKAPTPPPPAPAAPGLPVGVPTSGDPGVPAAGSCHSTGGLPDRACTPGATNPAVTQANVASTVCSSGWTATVRPPESYTEALKVRQMGSYGDSGPIGGYEEDHLVPLELGGAPSDPRNLWPEPGASPNPKDRVEDAGREAVCSGRLTLAAAQAAIAADWITFGERLGLSDLAPSAGPAATTTTAVTTTTTSPPPPTAAPATNGVSNTAPSGKYYKPGEFCPERDLGATITDPYGTMTCQTPAGDDRPHWEPS